jgi:hypothetical protein
VSSAVLLLGGVEVSVFLVERELRKGTPVGFRELFGPLHPRRKAPRHRPQRELGIDVQPPRHVHRRKEDVAELFEHPRIRLGLRRRLADLRERLLQLAHLVVEITDSAGGVRVLEVDRSGAPLQLSRVQQCGKRFWDVVENLLATAFLLAFQILPALFHLAGRAQLSRRLEDMRMSRHEFVVDAPRDRGEIAAALLLEEQGEEVGLEEQVTQLVLELGAIAAECGVLDLVGLFDGVRDDRARGLLAVPGAVAAEPLGQALEVEKGVGELFRFGAQPVAVLVVAAGL